MNQNQDQIKSWYQAQKDGKWKLLTNSLSQNSLVKAQLNNFITTIYSKFREQKNLSPDFKPTIEFKGFSGWQDFSDNPNKMGHCDSQLKTTWQSVNGQKIEGSEAYSGSLSIVLSQKLLLSKLGMPELITSYQESSSNGVLSFKWESLSVSFKKLIQTIAHEIAHAYQFLVNEDEIKSQCESSGDRDSQGRLKHPQLAYEHTALTQEIQAMTLKLSEYQKFKSWWEGKAENILPEVEVRKTDLVVVEKASEASPKNQSETIEQKASDNSDLPTWVFPVGIIGVVLLVGLVYSLFKKRTKKNL